jgi:hypothetical protein
MHLRQWADRTARNLGVWLVGDALPVVLRFPAIGEIAAELDYAAISGISWTALSI